MARSATEPMKLTIKDKMTTDPTEPPLIANLLIRSETEPTDPTDQPLDPELFTGKPEPSHVPCLAELDWYIITKTELKNETYVPFPQ